MNNNSQDIDLMFSAWQGREFMLEAHQVSFVNNLKNFYSQKGYLTPRQFHWLTAYWSVYAGCGDMEPDPRGC